MGACSAGQFACQSDAQCGDGVCLGSACAFEDPQCDSGLRFGAHAAGGLANQCAELPEGSTTATSPGTTTSSSAMSTDAGIADDTGTTTIALDASTSGDAMSTTGDGTGSSDGGMVPLDPDLVAWYACERPTKAGVVDSTGHGHDAKCTACPVGEPGIKGNACTFSGAERLEIDPNDEIAVDLFTVAAWVRTDGPAADEHYTVVGKPVGDSFRNTWELIFSGFNGALSFCWGSDIGAACASVEAKYGEWMHLAGTFDGMTGRLYIDGVLVDESSEPLPDGIGYDGHPMIIGGDIDSDMEDHNLVGQIDDVRLYGRALTDEEVGALAQP